MAVGKRWNGQGYEFFNPRIYKAEASEYIKHLPFYLARIYGAKTKEEFSNCAPQTIHNTKLNAITGKEVSEKDQDLVDTTEAHKSMAWFGLH